MEALLGVSTSSTIQMMEHHEPQVHWQNIIIIARPPEFFLITWILPPNGKMTSKTEPLAWVFQRFSNLELQILPSLFSTRTIMTENELSPLKSPGGCGSSALTTGKSLYTELHTGLCHFRYRKRKATDSFVFPSPVVFTLTYLKGSCSFQSPFGKPNRLKRVSKEC